MEHRSLDKKVWVSYGDSVYDITEFLKVHPGGSDKVMMAAGGAIEPFWEMYSFHKNQNIKDMLKPFKIGQLNPKEIMKPEDIPDFTDLKKDDLERSPDLEVLQNFPMCAETNRKYLTDDFITPARDIFIRNHSLVPSKPDYDSYELNIFKKDDLQKVYTLD